MAELENIAIMCDSCQNSGGRFKEDRSSVTDGQGFFRFR